MKLKVVIILDNKEREYEYSQRLKSAFKMELNAEVTLIGSIAELQRMEALLFLLKPHVVCMSQVFEQSCRRIAAYVKKSGGTVIIVPSEVRPSEAYARLTKSKLTFNELVDYVFLPGENLASTFSHCDIHADKYFLTGSPKIDVSLSKKTESKKRFLQKRAIPATYQKYITFFTSFIDTSIEYLYTDPLFKDQLAFKQSFNKTVIATREKYQDALDTLASEFPHYAFLLKPHPLEKQTLKATFSNVFLVSNATAPDLFKTTDLAIHWLSTVALECWFHNIPVIEYFPIFKKQFLPDFHEGNPLLIKKEELISAVLRYTARPIEKRYLSMQQKYLEYSFTKLDGKSAERIAKALKKRILPNTHLKYALPSSWFGLALVVFEKTIGVSLSRTLLTIVIPAYQKKYALQNFLYEK